METRYAIGVDVGGSHISVAALRYHARQINITTRINEHVNNKASAEEITNKWGSAIIKVLNKVGIQNVEGIGIAMPGPFDYMKGISLFDGETKKYESTYGLNISDILRKYLELPEEKPVRFINDATAFAIGEEWIGKAKGFNRSLSITLGTGLGSGFIFNGLPAFKSEDIPKDGYIYNIPFNNGLADDYFSTRGLIDRYKNLSGVKLSGVKEICDLALHDNNAKELLKNFGVQLANFLYPILLKFEAQVLVVGGNISKAFYLFGSEMTSVLKSKGLKVKVFKSDLLDDAQIAGAARIVNNDYWNKLFPVLY